MSTGRTLLLVLSIGSSACATAGESRNTPPDATKIDAALDDSHQQIDGGIDSPAGSCASAFTGLLATWSFSGAPGSQVSTPSSAAASGVTAGDLSRATGLTPTAGATSINSSNWSTSAQLDASKYYTLSISAPAGCVLDLTSLSIDAKASASGPASAAVATSADGFAQSVAASTSAPSTPTVSASIPSGSLEIRIYGFAATTTSGTLRLEDTLSVTGALR